MNAMSLTTVGALIGRKAAAAYLAVMMVYNFVRPVAMGHKRK